MIYANTPPWLAATENGTRLTFISISKYYNISIYYIDEPTVSAIFVSVATLAVTLGVSVARQNALNKRLQAAINANAYAVWILKFKTNHKHSNAGEKSDSIQDY